MIDGSKSNLKLVIQARVCCTSFGDYKKLFNTLASYKYILLYYDLCVSFCSSKNQKVLEF